MSDQTAVLLAQLPAVAGGAVDLQDLLLLFEKGGLSLLLGLLVGLERERALADARNVFAGVRTFPLIGLLGFLCALLGQAVGAWAAAVLLGGFLSIVTAAYVMEARAGHPGATSEVAALLVFVLGMLVCHELFAVAIASAVVLMAFLSLKRPLRELVDRVREEDIYATLKFAVITAIVLPVLPDQAFGPYGVLNPRQIWYMVVLIAGISFLGYLLVKVMGPGRGIALTGLLGGLVSSTAVTLSFSQKSREAEAMGRTFAASIVLACSIMYPRILAEIAVVNTHLLRFIWPWLAGLALTGVAASALFLLGRKSQAVADVDLRNPFELRSAIKFGALFALILLVSRAAQDMFGTGGTFIAAALAGATDVDAITLSMAKLSSKGEIGEAQASMAILIAVAVNTCVKAGMALSMGSRLLRRWALPGFGALAVVAIGMIVALLVLYGV